MRITDAQVQQVIYDMAAYELRREEDRRREECPAITPCCSRCGVVILGPSPMQVSITHENQANAPRHMLSEYTSRMDYNFCLSCLLDALMTKAEP